MSKYLLNNITPAGKTIAPEELGEAIRKVTELTTEMQSAGVWVFALPLSAPSSSTVVSNEHGKILLADGPFAETKEYVGGFTVIDVADLDAALYWADKTAQATGLRIEVRPAANFG